MTLSTYKDYLIYALYQYTDYSIYQIADILQIPCTTVRRVLDRGITPEPVGFIMLDQDLFTPTTLSVSMTDHDALLPLTGSYRPHWQLN
jgi:hypothetical protein